MPDRSDPEETGHRLEQRAGYAVRRLATINVNGHWSTSLGGEQPLSCRMNGLPPRKECAQVTRSPLIACKPPPRNNDLQRQLPRCYATKWPVDLVVFRA